MTLTRVNPHLVQVQVDGWWGARRGVLVHQLDTTAAVDRADHLRVKGGSGRGDKRMPGFEMGCEVLIQYGSICDILSHDTELMVKM